MKNMILAVALVAGFAACRSETKSLGDDSSANVPAATKAGCCAAEKAACTDAAKAECAADKKACTAEKPQN
jgi:hypothetical protein